MTSEIEENIARVRERLAAACARAGRRPKDVRLVAATKTVSADRIRQAYQCGLSDFGENRVREAGSKREALADLAITWHLIGHLQSNKAKPARDLFAWVHSVDSLRLAERLHRAASGSLETLSPNSRRLKVLIEVNLGGEATKSGIAEAEAMELAGQIGRLDSLQLCGWMLVPPYSDEPEASRPYFFRLRELAKVINSAGLPGVATQELSMGMSHDFEVAIEEGATIVRVGTAIFGPRS